MNVDVGMGYRDRVGGDVGSVVECVNFVHGVCSVNHSKLLW